jgi:hypothetical protein
MMEAVSAFEVLVDSYQSTQRYRPEGNHLSTFSILHKNVLLASLNNVIAEAITAVRQ